jgi:MerR family transcriptional regulator, copper efflux regulator
MKRKYLTVKDAAEHLGVSPLTLRNWDKLGKLTAFRHPINNYRVYREDQLELFLRSIESPRVVKKTSSGGNQNHTVPKKIRILSDED